MTGPIHHLKTFFCLLQLEEDQEKQNEKEEEEDLRSDSDWSDFTVEDSSQSQELVSDINSAEDHSDSKYIFQSSTADVQ